MTEKITDIKKSGPTGVLAEFSGPDELVAAVRKAREAGYTKMDACSPFPVHGLDDAIGMKKSKLQLITLGGGVTGCFAALLMEYWMVTVDYPVILAGKPHFSLPAFIPIMFEMTILFAALATFTGLLVLGGLPNFNHALTGSPRFKRATSDKFFMFLESADPKFQLEATLEFAKSIGADAVEIVEEQ